jgi:hypothetical protein
MKYGRQLHIISLPTPYNAGFPQPNGSRNRHAFVKPTPPTPNWGKRWIDTRYRAMAFKSTGPYLAPRMANSKFAGSRIHFPDIVKHSFLCYETVFCSFVES